ncbi:hypothetical protein HMPREF3214_01602 [Alloscardovia omnicolens]|nr:hypothetical protein HMPREF3214_01602 [Alloscardovia omnicolens]
MFTQTFLISCRFLILCIVVMLSLASQLPPHSSVAETYMKLSHITHRI